MLTKPTLSCLILLLSIAPPLVFASDATRLIERQQIIRDTKKSLRSLQSGSDTLRDRAVRAQRPVIGILLGEGENANAKIIGVTPQGAAAEGGVRSGDLLVSIDGNPLEGEAAAARIDAARRMLADLRVGSKVTLGLSRDGKPLSITLSPRVSPTLSMIDNLDVVPREVRRIVLRSPSSNSLPNGQASATADQDVFIDVIHGTDTLPCNGEDCQGKLLREALRWNQLNLVTLEPQLGRYFGTDQGVLVLTSGSLRELQAGDVILAVEGTPVKTPQEVMRVIGEKQPGDTAKIEIIRDKGHQQIQVTAPDQAHAALELIQQRPEAPPLPPLPAPRTSEGLPL